MPTQTILIATLTPPSKVVDFSGSTVIAVRETIALRVYGAGTASAAGLLVGLKRNGVLCAITDGMTDHGAYYDCELDLNHEEMVDAMDGMSGTMTRRFEFFIWDSVNDDLLANGSIPVQWNPYSSDMENPSPIDGVGEVFTATEKARLASMEDVADATYYEVVAADATLTIQAQSRQVILVDTSGDDVEVILPTAAGHVGTIEIVKASADNTLTITPSGAETINGNAGSATLTVGFSGCVLFPFDGNWVART